MGAGQRGRYAQQRSEVYDAQGNLILDDQGYTPTLPGKEVAVQAQYGSEKFIAGRNAGLRRDALASLRGGLGNLQSYRPGGAAALASPFYSQQADVLMNSQQDVPDLLHDVRADAQAKADRARRIGQAIQVGATVIGAAATIATGGVAAPLAGALIAGASAYGQSQQQVDVNSDMPGVPTAVGGPGPYTPPAQQPQPGTPGTTQAPSYLGDTASASSGPQLGGGQPGNQQAGKRVAMGGQQAGQGGQAGAGGAGGQAGAQPGGGQAGAPGGAPGAAGAVSMGPTGVEVSTAATGAMAQHLPPQIAQAADIGATMMFIQEDNGDAYVAELVAATKAMQESLQW